MSVIITALTRLARAIAFSLGLALLTLGLTRSASAATYYVSPTGTGNGSTWAMAGPLQPTIAAAHSGDQVWALKGIYVGNFTATDGVAVYGHFAGSETSINQRLLTNTADTSYLDANNSGTAWTIPSAATGTNTLDGFTVENGPSRGINDSSTDHLVISYCTISGNSISNANGGGIYTQGTTADISDCTFSGNSVNGGYYSYVTLYGGGIYTASGTTATISNCTFSSNNANASTADNAYGGAVATAGTATISSSTLTSNTAANTGGGVYATGNAITVNDCTFTSNGNGGVNAGCTSNTITGSIFTSNTGRGVTVGGPNTLSVSGCTFTGNSVTNGSGGGLYTSSLIGTITGCVFKNNSANGGYYAYVTLYGGGLYTEAQTSTTISDCTFMGNTVTASTADVAHGGGFGGFGTPSLIDCTFLGDSPGEIDLENAGTMSNPAIIKDSFITGPVTSPGDGIDLAISGGSASVYATVANNTIVGTIVGINIGTGSGTGGAVSVANNILDGNTGGLNDNSSVMFVSSHNDVYGNSSYGYNIGVSASDLTVDPMFVNAESGNYHLATTSPLINAGDDTYVSQGDTDLDGNPRIVGSHVDIGCYEYTSPLVPKSIAFSPATVLGGAQTTVTVTLSAAAPSGGAVVMLTSSNTTVAPVPASVTVAAGATTATFTVTAGTVSTSTAVTVTASYNGTSVHGTLTVAPQGIASVTLSGYTVTGGDGVLGTVTLVAAASAATTVTLTPGGSCSTPASVTIPAGSKSATFNVSTSVVPAKIGASVIATLNSKSTKVGFTLLPPQVATLTLIPNMTFGGTAVFAEVVLTVPAPSGGITVNLTSSNPNAASVPATVTVPAGAVTAMIPVTTYAVTGVTKVTIDAETTALIGAGSMTLLP